MSKYIVTVDYTKSLAQMIEPGGYDIVHPDITQEHFPSVASCLLNKEVEITLVHLNRRVTDAAIDAEMERLGLRDASHLEGLPLGEKYPDLQREFPILIRGSSWTPRDSYTYHLCLDADERGRHLGLFGGFRAHGWEPRWRFAAVRLT